LSEITQGNADLAQKLATQPMPLFFAKISSGSGEHLFGADKKTAQ
jgi:hypothetical protein